ncbi:MAG: DUF488 domain-containing protein [Proteobacteria bacterium]|nr:DUF488 domain-containing protein [Pseudomonadota bacterium]MBI3497803.1 DUF488 domain-containing protein [Pseudomonadota bacterium]
MSTSDKPPVFTIGHSNHSWEAFLDLVNRHAIEMIVDVRSVPSSRRYPWFARDALAKALKEAGHDYHYLGDRLGGRPKDSICYAGGAIDYGRVAATPAFRSGLDELAELAVKHRLALMCAEREPMDCHRSILVCRHLAPLGFAVCHIHGDGRPEAQDEFEERLIQVTSSDDGPLLAGLEERPLQVQLAYNRRGRKMAFRA